MPEPPRPHSRAPDGAGPRRLAISLILLGLAGIASLLLLPIETLAPLPYPPLTARLLATIQPAFLLLIAALVGAWAAPRLALDAPALRAWLERRPAAQVLRNQLPAALAVAALTAGILTAYGELWSARTANLANPGARLAEFEAPLVTRLFYGGITEELIARWGLMSLFAWLAWKVAGAPRPVPGWAYWFGAGVAALLFAAGHLPLLFLLVPDPPVALVSAVIAGNAAPGLLFGWLFWKRGLEAAMMAHALAHLLAWSVAALLA